MADPNASFICTGVPTTPVLLLGPGARRHHLPRDVAQDANFTTTEMPNVPSPPTPDVRAEARRPAQRPLPESQAGSAYFWHVTALRHQRLHAVARLAESSTLAGLEGVPQGVAGHRRPVDHVQPQRQRDHLQLAGLLRHQPGAPSWNGRPGNQTARTYRIQVATDPSFSADRRHARRSTRRPTPHLTGSTPTAPTTGACRPSTPEQLGLTFSPVRQLHQGQPARRAELAGGWRPGVRDDPAALERPGVRCVVHG